MYDAPGIGLAAIQVGVPKRLLVIDLQEPDTETGEAVRNPMVFINPQILEGSEQHSVYQEGCLSVPEQYADVERPAVIRASWRSEEHTSELQSLMRNSYAVFCLKKKTCK